MTRIEDDGLARLEQLRLFQDAHRLPVTDLAKQDPAAALHSLREAAHQAPSNYRPYLDEAIDCYEAGAYRGAVLMVWSAAIEHLYSTIAEKPGGLRALGVANEARFGNSSTYRRISKKNDLLYLNDKNFFQLCEDVGVFNKNARALLDEALATRNRCGHPTGFVVGREETVVFIERLINNILSGAMMDWP